MHDVQTALSMFHGRVLDCMIRRTSSADSCALLPSLLPSHISSFLCGRGDAREARESRTLMVGHLQPNVIMRVVCVFVCVSVSVCVFRDLESGLSKKKVSGLDIW